MLLLLNVIVLQDIGLGFVNHGELLVEYVVTCKLKSARVKPTHVSVIGDVTRYRRTNAFYEMKSLHILSVFKFVNILLYCSLIGFNHEPMAF